MYTKEQLQKLFVIKNMVPVRVPKGDRGATVKLSNFTATYLTDLKEGSAIALLTDKGNWYLVGKATQSPNQSTRRIIEYRKTTLNQKKVAQFIAVLQSISPPFISIGGNKKEKKYSNFSGKIYRVAKYGSVTKNFTNLKLYFNDILYEGEDPSYTQLALLNFKNGFMVRDFWLSYVSPETTSESVSIFASPQLFRIEKGNVVNQTTAPNQLFTVTVPSILIPPLTKESTYSFTRTQLTGSRRLIEIESSAYTTFLIRDDFRQALLKKTEWAVEDDENSSAFTRNTIYSVVDEAYLFDDTSEIPVYNIPAFMFILSGYTPGDINIGINEINVNSSIQGDVTACSISSSGTTSTQTTESVAANLINLKVRISFKISDFNYQVAIGTILSYEKTIVNPNQLPFIPIRYLVTKLIINVTSIVNLPFDSRGRVGGIIYSDSGSIYDIYIPSSYAQSFPLVNGFNRDVRAGGSVGTGVDLPSGSMDTLESYAYWKNSTIYITGFPPNSSQNYVPKSKTNYADVFKLVTEDGLIKIQKQVPIKGKSIPFHETGTIIQSMYFG